MGVFQFSDASCEDSLALDPMLWSTRNYCLKNYVLDLVQETLS